MDGRQFYMSWSDKSSVWCFTQSSEPSLGKDGEQTYQNIINFGTYAVSDSVAGIQLYNLTTPILLSETVLAGAMTYAISQIMKAGIGFVTEALTTYIVAGLSKVGIKASSKIVGKAIAAVTTNLVFAVTFICIIYLFNWLNRLYTIRLIIYNWSGTDDWEVNGQYVENAIFPGEEEQLTEDSNLNFTIPKALDSGDSVAPPGFDNVEVLDSVCYTATVVWQNNNTFAEGCSMALQLRKAGTEEGFMWAFSCPRFANNKHAADDGLQDPESYFTDLQWNENPLEFEIQSTSDSTPITLALEALSGGEDNAYTVIMNIDRSS